jgi:hypothetical protein
MQSFGLRLNTPLSPLEAMTFWIQALQLHSGLAANEALDVPTLVVRSAGKEKPYEVNLFEDDPEDFRSQVGWEAKLVAPYHDLNEKYGERPLGNCAACAMACCPVHGKGGGL